MKNGKSRRGNGFDWERAKALASTNLEEAGVDLEVVFRERARLLAKAEHDETETAGLDYLRFRAGPFTFALRLDQVGSVIRPMWITQVPGAPLHLRRVIHVGGRIVAVADLATLLGAQLGKEHQDWRVILVDDGRRRVGLLSTAVCDIARFETGELSNLSVRESQVASFVHGATPDMTLVLDGGRLIDELGGRSAQERKRTSEE